jgi:DNA repair photolyase
MIISASRRTDIPTYYSEWFFNRIKEGFVFVRNPMNLRQISRIEIASDIVDGIVFWTKNPIPMLARLNELEKYMFCFQFTITPYERDIEPNIPDKDEKILPAFKKLSKIMGADRIVWRYDPIMINERYPIEFHVQSFEKIAAELHEYAVKVTISFIDEDYRSVKNNIKELALIPFPTEAQIELGARLSEIARRYGLAIDACAEKIDLQKYGIEHARCIDDRLFSNLLCCRLDIEKDKTQRLECDCAASIDIGMYNTCRNGCLYCYANYNQNAVSGNFEKHNPLSPLLYGEAGKGDTIYDRAVKSCKDAQRSLFDIDRRRLISNKD